MKLSIAWIFDHIQGSFKDHDIPKLVEKLSRITCEIEDCSYITVNLKEFTLGLVEEIKEDAVVLFSQELREPITVSKRDGCKTGQVYLLKKDKKGWRWAEGQDLHSSKEGPLPAISVSDKDLAGSWKNSFESEDYIITIDNVSLTHRPDLWGHRGFAREIAAILGKEMVVLDELITTIPIKEYEHSATATPEADFSFKIEDQKGCRRLAGMLIPEIEPEGSWLYMAQRLLKVDTRAISGLVDATNYVMLDLSQPLHAFDAAKLTKKQLIARRAKKNEALRLLDEQELSLGPDNLVISDGQEALALAGIMGGADSGVSPQTTSLLVESASFDPTVIRKSSTEFKLRSEASARFEKNLDPNQNIDGLLRFIRLLQLHASAFVMPQVISSVGLEAKPRTLTVTHDFIEEKIGVAIKPGFIVDTLARLGFLVDEIVQDPRTYSIIVPTFRGTKDIILPEDIVEEIVRFYGLDKIPHRLPSLLMRPSGISRLFYLDEIRNYCAFTGGMHEVRNYAFFDEPFLKELHWEPAQTIALKNPVSENHYRLVTSLVPNLLKTVQTNEQAGLHLAFFECNDIWHLDGKKLYEQKSLAGVFHHAKHAVNFYEKKEFLNNLFAELSLAVTWHKADPNECAPWFHPYKTAVIKHNGSVVGYAGEAHPGFIKTLGGNAYIFELNAEELLSAKRSIVHYTPLAKYQATSLDVSMLVPKKLTARELEETIKKAHPAIFDVTLIDFFEKEEWADQRSITLRYFARADDKTLTGEEIEAIGATVTQKLQKLGATIR